MSDRLSKSRPFPPGPFDVVYADPPWRYKHGTCDPKDAIENKYPTMPLRAICRLPVIEIASDHSALFMWTTAPKLGEAMEVIGWWGFELVSGVVWDKLRMGLGYYARIQHEHLLIATRGKPGVPPVNARVRSVVRVPHPGIHSRKPKVFRTMIENMYPNARRIELFARQRFPGWEAWGNDPAILAGASEV